MKKRINKKPPEVIKDNRILFIVLIGIITLAVYYNSFFNDFVYDDELHVLGDSTITHLSNIPKFYSGEEGIYRVINRYYRPVVPTFYAIDYSLWKYNPMGFHITNVMIHLVNSILFFEFLLLIFRRCQDKKNLRQVSIFSFMGALIFAVHPLHTEAVAWICGRTDSLSFTFFIASFICYLKYSENQSRKILYFVLTFLFYGISLLAKEVPIMLPIAFILYDVLMYKIKIKELIKERILFYLILAVISVLFLLMRGYVLKDFPEHENYNYFYGKSTAATMFTMLETLPLYLRLLVVPTGLIYNYNGFLPYIDNITNFNVIISLICLFVLLYYTIYCWKKNPMVSYSIIFFFLTLFPVLNIIPTTNLAAERFLYIPSVSLVLLLITLGLSLDFTKYKYHIYTVSVVIIFFFSFLTISRNSDWKNNDSLYMSAEGKPGTVIDVNIGNIYLNKRQYDKAEIYYRRAVELKEDNLVPNNSLGRVLMLEGKYDSSYIYLKRAYEFDTLHPEPRFSLGLLYAMRDSLPQAINEFEMLDKVYPHYKNSEQLLKQLRSKLQVDTSMVK